MLFALFILAILNAADSASLAVSGSLFSAAATRTLPAGQLRFHSFRDDAQVPVIKQLQLQGMAAPSCKRWSVVTTIAAPTAAVQKAADMGPSWCLVIVADRKTPTFQVRGTSTVIVLTPEWQEQLAKDLAFVQQMPWNSFGRKSVGYMFAISWGAQAIFDIDDDNLIMRPDALDAFVNTTSLVVRVPQSSHPIYNPLIRSLHHHFIDYNNSSAAVVWPRGLPLDHIQDPSTFNASVLYQEASNVAVFQSLADHDPDVDAIYRLTRPLPLYFRAHDAPLMLPLRVAAPLNAQACLFLRPAFWSMLLPTTVHGRVSDIWRGYIAQRLLWDTGHSAVFTPPLVDQHRNSHNNLADFNAEGPLYEQAGKLLEVLQQWDAPSCTSLPCKLEQLYAELYSRNFLQLEDVHMVQDWIQALIDVGYRFPQLSSPPPSSTPPAAMTAQQQQPPPPPSCLTFKGLELFLPVAPKEDALSELQQLFMPGFKGFWPLDQVNLHVILDADRATKNFTEQVTSTVADLPHWRVTHADPPPMHMHGHDRQQWLMFWADRLTSADYVGFVDTDTVFITAVMAGDIFVAGKPRVVVTYGEPKDRFWAQVPKSTHLAVGKKEPFRAMTYFPVVIKTSHLRLMREHIKGTMRAPSFDAAMASIISEGAYSQFNIMATYLWWFHHEEYCWDVMERTPGWKGPVPEGQVSDPWEAGITPDMLAQSHLPRLSIHWTYEPNNTTDTIDRVPGIKRAMRTGYCHSRADPDPTYAFCEGIDASSVNHLEWLFESEDYSARPGTFEAHRARLQRRRACGNHRWNPAFLDFIA